MKNLRELILKKMEDENYTISRFADKCEVSEREISRIKNGEANNIRFDVFVKICENSNISYKNVFNLKEDTYYLEKILNNILLKINNELQKIQSIRKE